MQITSVGETLKVLDEIAVALASLSAAVDVFVAPCFNALHSSCQVLKNRKLKLAGQNMHYQETGAFTGETSVLSLVDAGCEYVILGHSERRRIFGETDEMINQKVHLALAKGLKSVLCIGETAKERESGKTAEVNEKQLTGSLAGITEQQLKSITIAYEPVWAINNKFLNPGIEIKPATAQQASEAHLMVREWFRRQYSNRAAEEMRIMYGGSMSPKNAEELLSLKDIDGGLIGGASLSAETFVPIIDFAEKIASRGKDYQWEGNTLKFD